MDVRQLEKQADTLTRQRNISFMGLALALVAVCGMTTVVASRKESIVLVPTTVDQYTIVKGRVPDDYLIAVTRDAASLLLNRHPHDTSYFRDNILRMTDPAIHDDMLVAIEQDELDNKFRAGRKNWMPEEVCRLPGEDLVTEIVGTLETYVNGQRINSERIARRFHWRLEGTRLFWSDIHILEPGEEQCKQIGDKS